MIISASARTSKPCRAKRASIIETETRLRAELQSKARTLSPALAARLNGYIDELLGIEQRPSLSRRGCPLAVGFLYRSRTEIGPIPAIARASEDDTNENDPCTGEGPRQNKRWQISRSMIATVDIDPKLLEARLCR